MPSSAPSLYRELGIPGAEIPVQHLVIAHLPRLAGRFRMCPPKPFQHETLQRRGDSRMLLDYIVELARVRLQIKKNPIAARRRIVRNVAVFPGALAGAVDELPTSCTNIGFLVLEIFAKDMVPGLDVPALQIRPQAAPMHDGERIEIHDVHDG